MTADGVAPRPGAPEQRARVAMIMGLPFSVHLRGLGDPEAESTAVQAVWDDLRRAEEIFSTYRADSDISRIDRGELTVAAADPLVGEVLALADLARTRTDGAFDVRYGGRLDPSGIVKGWAAARAAAHLEVLGTDFYLNAGGDVLLRAGAGRSWRVGIEHPADPSGLLAVLERGEGAVATSGNAHRGSHIVDPATGAPAAGAVQATVCGPDLTWSDVFATALVAAPYRHLELPEGYEFLLVAADGAVTGSAGMASMVRGR